jgi:hypothetical protein
VFHLFFEGEVLFGVVLQVHVFLVELFFESSFVLFAFFEFLLCLVVLLFEESCLFLDAVAVE